MKTRTTQLTVAPEGEPIFSERTYTVTIDDLSAGEFVVVTSHSDSRERITIDPEDWDELRSAIDTLIKECRS